MSTISPAASVGRRRPAPRAARRAPLAVGGRRGAVRGAISASTAPTSTVSPSAAWIFTTVPRAGAGTSASTLSVEISTSVSSASIVVALLLVPLEDRALGHRLAHRGQGDLHCRVRPPCRAPTLARRQPRRLGSGCAAFLAHELGGADERADRPEHGHGDRQAQGDDPRAAAPRGRATHMTIQPRPWARPKTNSSGCSPGTSQTSEQARVDRRVGERQPLEACRSVEAHAASRAAAPCGAAARRPRRARRRCRPATRRRRRARRPARPRRPRAARPGRRT